MAPGEIWKALGISRQGTMNLLHPLLDAGLVEKVVGNKTGHYVLETRGRQRARWRVGCPG